MRISFAINDNTWFELHFMHFNANVTLYDYLPVRLHYVADWIL